MFNPVFGCTLHRAIVCPIFRGGAIAFVFFVYAVSRRIFVYGPSSIAELSSLAAESRSGLTGSKREENERRNAGGKAGALRAPTAPRRS
jgi:hypothetical protein